MIARIRKHGRTAAVTGDQRVMSNRFHPDHKNGWK